MNRDQAEATVAKFMHSHGLVRALEALGVLKLEEPASAPATIAVACVSGTSSISETGKAFWGPGVADIRLDRMIDALRIAGYEVTKR